MFLLLTASFITIGLCVIIDPFPSSVVNGQSYTFTYSPKDQVCKDWSLINRFS